MKWNQFWNILNLFLNFFCIYLICGVYPFPRNTAGVSLSGLVWLNGAGGAGISSGRNVSWPMMGDGESLCKSVNDMRSSLEWWCWCGPRCCCCCCCWGGRWWPWHRLVVEAPDGLEKMIFEKLIKFDGTTPCFKIYSKMILPTLKSLKYLDVCFLTFK